MKKITILFNRLNYIKTILSLIGILTMSGCSMNNSIVTSLENDLKPPYQFNVREIHAPETIDLDDEIIYPKEMIRNMVNKQLFEKGLQGNNYQIDILVDVISLGGNGKAGIFADCSKVFSIIAKISDKDDDSLGEIISSSRTDPRGKYFGTLNNKFGLKNNQKYCGSKKEIKGLINESIESFIDELKNNISK